MQWWRTRSPTICAPQAGGPGKPACSSSPNLRPENQGSRRRQNPQTRLNPALPAPRPCPRGCALPRRHSHDRDGRGASLLKGMTTAAAGGGGLPAARRHRSRGHPRPALPPLLRGSSLSPRTPKTPLHPHSQLLPRLYFHSAHFTCPGSRCPVSRQLRPHPLPRLRAVTRGEASLLPLRTRPLPTSPLPFTARPPCPQSHPLMFPSCCRLSPLQWDRHSSAPQGTALAQVTDDHLRCPPSVLTLLIPQHHWIS